MLKGIIILNDIPIDCSSCRFSVFYECGIGFCRVKREYIYDDKPDWCPIRPIPKKKTLTGDVSNAEKTGNELVRAGWNACIDELLKDGG